MLVRLLRLFTLSFCWVLVFSLSLSLPSCVQCVLVETNCLLRSFDKKKKKTKYLRRTRTCDFERAPDRIFKRTVETNGDGSVEIREGRQANRKPREQTIRRRLVTGRAAASNVRRGRR